MWHAYSGRLTQLSTRSTRPGISTVQQLRCRELRVGLLTSPGLLTQLKSELHQHSVVPNVRIVPNREFDCVRRTHYWELSIVFS